MNIRDEFNFEVFRRYGELILEIDPKAKVTEEKNRVMIVTNFLVEDLERSDELLEQAKKETIESWEQQGKDLKSLIFELVK